MKTTTSNVTGIQLRAARAILQWRVQEMAKRTRVSVAHLRRAELLDGVVNPTEGDKEAIIRVLERNGVTLTESDDLGSGAFCKRG